MPNDAPPRGLSDEKLLDFYLKTYEYEQKQRDSIVTSLTQLTGLLTLASGAVLFYIRNLPPHRSDTWLLWLYFFVGLAGLALVLSSVFVVRAWRGPEYHHLATPAMIEAWRADNRAYHEAFPDERPNLAERIQQGIISDVATGVGINRNTNRQRSGDVFTARTFALSAILFLVASMVPYTVIQRREAASRSSPASAQGDSLMTDKNEPAGGQAGQSGQGGQSGQSGESGPGNQGTQQPKQMVQPTKTPFPSGEKYKEGSKDIQTKDTISLGRKPNETGDG
jgi:hypothetical protein